MWLKEIQTQFVRDRLQETSFAQREYIHDLYLIDQLQRGRNLGVASHMLGKPRRLYTRYPAEAECIRLEIHEGHYVDSSHFTREHDQLAEAWNAQQKLKVDTRRQEAARKRALDAVEHATRFQQERDAWQQMGGIL